MFQQLAAFDAVQTGYQQMGDGMLERHTAMQWFERALQQGRMKRLMGGLIGAKRQLNTLADMKERVLDQHYIGVQTVALKAIRGSENRTREFDREFNPLADFVEQRWVSVASAQLKGVKLPPVELIKVGDSYYVRDGHHRISVAQARGQYDIEAIVVEWVVD
ncbi:MAG: ParB N-terminal domain-containing protein [Chloroflexi bacterium]|nr:ParB N-terminal domain-containing protein [Chloroflexota bacterium]